MKKFGEIEHIYTVTTMALKAKLVVELGTGTGNSSNAFLAGLKVTGGMLYSVDLYPQRPDVKPTIERLKGEKRVTFIKGDSVKVGKEWDKEGIDILLCDSNHGKRHVLKELEAWGKFNPKIIFIHDTLTPDKNYGSPYFAGKEYAEKHGKVFMHLDTCPEGSPGLGVIV